MNQVTTPPTETYPETGWYWHVHHDQLMEWCYGYAERAAYIRANKPASEIETRLHRMRLVKGKMPVAVVKARAEREKALAEWKKAWAEWQAEWDKARAEREKVTAEWDKAWAEHFDEIEALHKAECPNCPWSGQTIFPQAR